MLYQPTHPPLSPILNITLSFHNTGLHTGGAARVGRHLPHPRQPRVPLVWRDGDGAAVPLVGRRTGQELGPRHAGENGGGLRFATLIALS